MQSLFLMRAQRCYVLIQFRKQLGCAMEEMTSVSISGNCRVAAETTPETVSSRAPIVTRGAPPTEIPWRYMPNKGILKINLCISVINLMMA